MTPEGDDWIGPGETARRLGVTAKALRVYERERLIRPARTAAGWRVYGPEHLARLHLIVVLRDLGLPLKAVRSLLSQKTPSLVALLTVQQEALEAKRARIDRAIGLLTDARGDLAAGRALSLDDLTQLRKVGTQESRDTHYFQPSAPRRNSQRPREPTWDSSSPRICRAWREPRPSA
jgi:DNA-binding transcriptional MerR regulator